MGSVPTTNLANSKLFQPIQIGASQLGHRMALAPLTRTRNDNDHVPTEMMRQYYADRGAVPGTLVISEATAMAHNEEGQKFTPGFVSDAQVEEWRKVIDGVHKNGSVWFQQVWAMGRAADKKHIESRGFEYHSSSATPMPGRDVTPKEMTEEEIQDVIKGYVETAKRVRAAGGDGVEVHGAHGYLLDQFLSDAVNKRTDKWGGSVENRARLILEVIKQVSEAIGSDRVGLRLSPYAGFQGAVKSDIVAQYTYLINELKKISPLAYISLVESRGDPGHVVMGDKQINQGATLDFILELWDNRSPVLIAGGYNAENSPPAVDERYSKWDVIIVYGRPFIANPDLPFRVRYGIPFTPYNRATFYIQTEEGYNDYPFSQEFLNAKEKSLSAKM